MASPPVPAPHARGWRDADELEQLERQGDRVGPNAFLETGRRLELELRVCVVSGGVTALLVVAGVAAGVAIGVKMTKSAVQSGVDDSADKVIRMIGGDPTTGYGRVAHTIVDAFAGSALNG